MQESERRQRISSTPRLSPDEIATRSFSTSFRGFTESEVRAFLRRISDEVAAIRSREGDLLNAVDELEQQLRAPRPLDEQQLLDALGEETARLLRSAKEAADEIRSKAEERAARLIEEAQNDARQARAEAEEDGRRRTEDAEAHAASVVAEAERLAAELREETDRYVAEQRAHAERERDAAIEAARAEGRDMVEEAKALRERVLADLARRRNLVQAQLEELRTGRDHLLDSYRVVKRTFLEATDALAQVEARIPPRIARPGEVDLTVPDEPAAELPIAAADDDAAPTASEGDIDAGVPDGAPTDDGAATGDRPALADVDSLFARIRAGQEESAVAVADAPPEAAPDAPPAATEPAAAADDTAAPVPDEPAAPVVARSTGDGDAWRSRRAAELGGRTKPTVRAAKRAAQDEQNALLDAVRRHKGRPSPDDVMPTLDAQRGAWAEVLRGALDAAYGAGRRAGGGEATAAPDEVAFDAADHVAGPLRDRVVGVLGEIDAASDTATVAERIGARYREWKNEAVEGLVGDVLAIAWSRGVYDAAPDGTVLRWIAAEEGRCADCDDNALEPTVKGSSFPTGQPHPPAHSGCRCLLVPASATP
ncbi:MAG TPA: DivIVA domain-containing protein [Acidimicrobiia bacterium]|nr:DivIVA domain-containing protein [Acidimicrobiia bacterium]